MLKINNCITSKLSQIYFKICSDTASSASPLWLSISKAEVLHCQSLVLRIKRCQSLVLEKQNISRLSLGSEAPFYFGFGSQSLTNIGNTLWLSGKKISMGGPSDNQNVVWGRAPFTVCPRATKVCQKSFSSPIISFKENTNVSQNYLFRRRPSSLMGVCGFDWIFSGLLFNQG